MWIPPNGGQVPGKSRSWDSCSMRSNVLATCKKTNNLSLYILYFFVQQKRLLTFRKLDLFLLLLFLLALITNLSDEKYVSLSICNTINTNIYFLCIFYAIVSMHGKYQNQFNQNRNSKVVNVIFMFNLQMKTQNTKENEEKFVYVYTCASYQYH